MNFFVKMYSILFFLSLFFPVGADAHRLRIFAWSEGNKILGETAFSGGRTPKDVQVSVRDAATDLILLTVQTDKEGRFSFLIPQKAKQARLDILLVVNTGEGHRAEWPLPASEYLASSIVVNKENTLLRQKSVQFTSTVTKLDKAAIVLTEERIRIIVAEELDKQLVPVKHLLSEQKQDGPGLQDILGGIGYILGIAGLLAWIKAKKQQGGT